MPFDEGDLPDIQELRDKKVPENELPEKSSPKKPKTTFLLKRSKGLNRLGCKSRVRAEASFAVSWCVFKERSQFFYCVKTRQLTAFEASE